MTTETEDIEKADGDYMRRMLMELKEWTSPSVWERAHKTARGHAGGKASPRKPYEPDAFEKMAVRETTPRSARRASDEEVESMHSRLHQLWGEMGF